MTITSVPPLSRHHSSSSLATLEITVVSAEGLDSYSSHFSRVRPFITLTKLPTPTHDGGGFSPTPTATQEHKFRFPVDPTFFSDRHSCLYLELYNKRPIVGPAQLGWCLIPATDIGLLPPDSVRHLSYRLRARDGSRGHAIINLSVRMDGYLTCISTSAPPNADDTCQTVIGIPVTAMRGIGDGDCSSTATTSTSAKTER